jgi:hypothetical protein
MIPSYPQAAANWTMGLAQNLIPLNWTVTDGNITGIKCDPTLGNLGAFYQCAERLGHNRGSCIAWNEKINGTLVCSCSAFSGWDFSSFAANATYGTVDGCATRNHTNQYFNAVCCSISMIIATFTLFYALSTIWKGRAVYSRKPSITVTTLAWLCVSALSLFLWFCIQILADVVLSSNELKLMIQRRFAVPMFALSFVCALLSFPLM